MRDDVQSEVGHIATLEGVRGLALLWVVAFHYVALREAVPRDALASFLGNTPLVATLVRNGYLGVDLFFLLSGFLLVLPWYRRALEGREPPSARAFYARRVRRIVPAYYVQLGFLFAVAMPLLHGRDYWRHDLYVDAWNALAHALFLQGTSPLTAGSLGVNGALWTLAVEAQFYVLLPWVAPLFVRFPLRSALAAFATTALWEHAARDGLQPLVDAMRMLGSHWAWSEETVRHLLAMQLPAYLAHFALGMLLALAWLRLRERGVRIAPSARIAGIVAGATLLAAGLTASVPAARWCLLAALGALLFLAASADSRFARAVLGRGPLAFAGRVSYSAYLYHLPLLLLLGLWPLANSPAAPLLFAALLLVFAWISWRAIELPFLPRREALTGAPEQALSPLGSATPR